MMLCSRARGASPQYWRRLALPTGIVVVLSLSCSVGRSIGRGAAEGLEERSDTLAAVSREIVEAAGKAFADSVAPRLERAAGNIADTIKLVLDSAATRALAGVETRVRRLGDSLTAFLATDARDSLGVLLSHNVRLLRDSINVAVDEWITTLATSVESHLAAAVGHVADSAASRALVQLAASFDTSGTVGPALEDLGDRVVSRAIAAIARETEGGFGAVFWVLVIVVGLIVVSLVGRFIIELKRGVKDREDSLRIVSYAVQESRDAGLTHRVKELATQQGVEPWLNRFLNEKRLLLESDEETTKPS